jgi:hypothetical protein
MKLKLKHAGGAPSEAQRISAGTVLALVLATLLAFVFLFAAQPAYAYVGPGAAVGVVGSIVGLVAAVGLALVGLVLLPLRMMQKQRRDRLDGSKQSG